MPPAAALSYEAELLRAIIVQASSGMSFFFFPFVLLESLYGTWEVLLLYFSRISRCLAAWLGPFLYNASCWTALYLENLDASKISADPFEENLLVHQGTVWWTRSVCWSQLRCVYQGTSWSIRFTTQWALEILEYNKQKSRYPRDTSVRPVYVPFKFMGQDLSPAISFLHPSTNSSTSQSLTHFSFSLAVIFYDTTTTCATQVSILIPFLTRTAFLLIAPTLPFSSTRICPYSLPVSLIFLTCPLIMYEHPFHQHC